MKTFSFKVDPLTHEEYLEVYLRGQQLVNDPFLNKASAFSDEERYSLDIIGSLRYKTSTLDIQLKRNYENYLKKPTDIDKYVFLQALLNRNEILFYRLLLEHLEEMLPIVYTPTVGQACLQLSHITRKYRGIYLNPDNIRNIDKIFQSISSPQISLIVVTDGERILGLGDLGSDGMGIPVGKVNLYIAAGGLHPACCLPITLDVGTNNEGLLNDPLYLGWNRKRLDGEKYYEFIEKFVLGVKRNFPQALLQWEDFAKHKAFTLLERYQDRILSFNDDIQGTGSIALSAMMTAMRIKKSTFKQQKYIIVGLGQAGSGIAFNIMQMLKEEGLTEEQAAELIYAIDVKGLITDDMPDLEPQMRMFAQKKSKLSNWKLEDANKINLKDVVKNSKATVLIGVTAQTGIFNHEILSEMAKNDERPVILALSNPTSKCECTPIDMVKATNGKGLMACGSPFEPVDGPNGKIYTSQCNNMYIFPGLGLGALISKTPKVTYKMFLAASKELSNLVTEEQMKQGLLLPGFENIREVSFHIAKRVAIEARDAGLGRLIDDEQYDQILRKAQWYPKYYNFRPGKAYTESTSLM
ncbi:MAG: NAD-dependent malic enzyme [Bacteroidia bacterium]|nr:NAD-dependent malic enzyme [Bacteroidia bacterium]